MRRLLAAAMLLVALPASAATVSTLDSPTGCGVTNFTTDGQSLYGFSSFSSKSSIPFGVVSYNLATASGQLLVSHFPSNLTLYSGLVYTDGALYGTATISHNGLIYAIYLNGGFAELGQTPHKTVGYTLMAHDHRLFGTGGGISFYNHGYVFGVDLKTGSVRVLHYFTDNGFEAQSLQPLTYRHGMLFGTTLEQDNGPGTIFQINEGGQDYKLLQTFNWNAQADQPSSKLSRYKGLLIGSSSPFATPPPPSGTIFAYDPDTRSAEVLFNFSNSGYGYPTNLVLSGATVYGTADGFNVDGTASGVVFSYELDTKTFAVLHSFGMSDPNGYGVGDIIVVGGVLYGGTVYGGPNGCGTLYSITP